MNDLRSYITNHIKAAVREKHQGFFREALVGFASADDPLFAEIPRLVGGHHARPLDFLPAGGTVVSFFLPFTQEVVKSNCGDGPVSREWGLSYLAANALINEVSQGLAEAVRERGHTAATVPATHNFDPQTLQCGWSHRSAAFVAGLGRFGLNRMLIGPSGCAGRYGTLFVGAEIRPDSRSAPERCLFQEKGKCGACVKACPPRALTAESYDRFKCWDHLTAISDQLNIDGKTCDVCGKCVAACPMAVI
ncbi:4Fe-4S dicluster domain-containing protein [Deltaproteobacteria bacterium OttesenSCG-928-M10]|nr:4Fe-4S dicluster domain-containing protein [Deltaproteobacteria bacterium OttesenSCG-928-M10]